MTQVIATGDAANVLRATTATSIEQLHDMLDGYIPKTPASASTRNSAVAPMWLGDTFGDLVYTPLPYGRCRVADSRVIGSPILSGQTRNLLLEDVANYAAQGGNGTYSAGTGSDSCGMPSFSTAYALSITLLSPAGNGVFKALPYASPPQIGNSILFNAGDYGANGDLIVRNCRGCDYDIAVNSSGASVHYIVDVIGYFMAPQATELSCYTTAETYKEIPGYGQTYAVAPFCNNGYSMVSTGCRGASYAIMFSDQTSGLCAAYNWNQNPGAFYVSRRCCRIPGRQ